MEIYLKSCACILGTIGIIIGVMVIWDINQSMKNR